MSLRDYLNQRELEKIAADPVALDDNVVHAMEKLAARIPMSTLLRRSKDAFRRDKVGGGMFQGVPAVRTPKPLPMTKEQIAKKHKDNIGFLRRSAWKREIWPTAGKQMKGMLPTVAQA